MELSPLQRVMNYHKYRLNLRELIESGKYDHLTIKELKEKVIRNLGLTYEPSKKVC